MTDHRNAPDAGFIVHFSSAFICFRRSSLIEIFNCGPLMAVASQELQLRLRNPTPFLQDDGVTVRAWGDLRLPWYIRVIGWFFKLVPVPQAVGIYPDGNRRFARAKGHPVHEGHAFGLPVLEKVGGNVQVLCNTGSKFGVCRALILVSSRRRHQHL